MRINNAGMANYNCGYTERKRKRILIICQIPLWDLQNTVLLCAFGFLQDILVYFK